MSNPSSRKKKNEDQLEKLKQYEKNLEESKKLVAAVGLPQEKVGGKAYGNGMTVLEVGGIQEYGAPEANIPSRSFIRVPFIINRKKIEKFIEITFKKVVEEGLPANIAIGRIGAFAQKIALESFSTNGYGKWQPLKPKTIKRKKSSAILIDTGILRQSITWVVRKK